MIENMKVEFGRTSDIDSWMRLVRKVSWNFPGLETEQSIDEHKIIVAVKKSPGYPDHANSDAWMIGKARYKDHDEVKAANHEVKYGGPGKKIKFDTLNSLLIYDVRKIIQQIKQVLNGGAYICQ